MIATLQAAVLLFAPGEHSITWEAPPSCPDAAYVRDRVAEQVRGVDVEATEFRAQVSAPAREGAPWRMQIAIGREGRRELEGESCQALADAAAMMIAISLNASVGEQETSIPEPPRIADPVEIVGAKPDGVDPVGPGPARPPDTRPRPEPSDDAARFAEPRRRRLGPPRAVLGVMTGLHGIGLPAIGAGLGGRLGVRWGPLRAALTGTHWIRRKRSVIDDVAASYQLGTGGLELCGVLALGRTPAQFELLACAEAEAGVLRAWGREASPSRTLRHRWLGLGGGLGAVWVPRSWIAVGLRIDLVVPLIGREFVIGNVSAGAIGPVDARGSLVFELRLPRIIGAG